LAIPSGTSSREKIALERRGKDYIVNTTDEQLRGMEIAFDPPAMKPPAASEAAAPSN